MDKQAIIERLGSRQAGSFCRVVVEREADTLAGARALGKILKRTEYRFQLTPYHRRTPVKEAVILGKREAPELPGWVSKSEIFPNGLKFWIGHNGQTYLALPVWGDNSHFDVSWFQNGRMVSEESIRDYLSSEEKRSLKRSVGEKEIREAQGQAVARGVKLENVKHVLGE